MSDRRDIVVIIIGVSLGMSGCELLSLHHTDHAPYSQAITDTHLWMSGFSHL